MSECCSLGTFLISIQRISEPASGILIIFCFSAKCTSNFFCSPLRAAGTVPKQCWGEYYWNSWTNAFDPKKKFAKEKKLVHSIDRTLIWRRRVRRQSALLILKTCQNPSIIYNKKRTFLVPGTKTSGEKKSTHAKKKFPNTGKLFFPKPLRPHPTRFLRPLGTPERP